MRKVSLFALAFGIALSILIVIIVWYLEIYQSGNASVSGMMGQMMGNQNPGGALYAMPQYVTVLTVAAIGITVLGIGGLVYYVIFPEIRPVAASTSPLKGIHSEAVEEQEKQTDKADAVAGLSWPVLIRTSKPEEKKILEVLASHNGSYLQKLIVKEAGLSKLKTHRIISRFAERGIVQVEKSGNTNSVTLSAWLGRSEADH